MRRILWTTLILVSCGGARAPAARPAPPATAVRTEAELPVVEPEWGAPIRARELDGRTRLPEAIAERALRARVGDALDESVVAGDVRRLLELEVFEDVTAEVTPWAGGVRLRYTVRERPRITRVDYVGVDALPPGRHVPLVAGELFDRARVARSTQALEDHYRASGFLDAHVSAESRRDRETVALTVRVVTGARYRIGAFEFDGNQVLSDRELVALVDTHDGSVNQVGRALREDLLDADGSRIRARYYDLGYLGVDLGKPRVTRDRRGHTLRVVFPLTEGKRYHLRKLTVAGDLRWPESTYRKLFALAPGAVFGRVAAAEGLARIREAHQKLDRGDAVEIETALDPESAALDATIQIRAGR